MKNLIFVLLLSVSLKAQTHAIRLCDQQSIKHCITFQVPASISANYTFTLPAVDGTSGQFVKTDGAGTLSWGTASGGGTPAGSDTDIQFNQSGAFGADTGKFTWDYTNHRLGVGVSSMNYSVEVK